MKPIIINSKAAQKDLLKIKSIHGDLVLELQNQAQKVDLLKQQRANEKTNTDAIRYQSERENRTSNIEMQKNIMDNSLKREELSIKRDSLNAI